MMTKPIANFLHIGKTGGSAVIHALMAIEDHSKYEIRIHAHKVGMRDIPEGEKVILFLRDPISRFVSAFYSRKRRGLPRYLNRWKPHEEELFEAFQTADEMAQALSDESSPFHDLALRGINRIGHMKPFSQWYGDFDYFESRMKDVLFIGFQDRLDADYSRLLKILEVGVWSELPQDDVKAHKSPTDEDKSISEHGQRFLKEWYRQDYEFIELCKGLRFDPPDPL